MNRETRMINGNEYVVATADDFGVRYLKNSLYSPGGFYELRYTGDAEYVYLPDYDSIFGPKTRTDSFVLKNYNTGNNAYVKRSDLRTNEYDYLFKDSSVKGVAGYSTGIRSTVRMFQGTTSDTLDLSGLHISGVTNMSNMFRDSQATLLDLGNFDTSSTYNMNNMFHGSKALSIDLSSFNTSSVTGMTEMFRDSSALRLDLRNFDTSNVRRMSGMFHDAKAEHIDVSTFDTRNVVAMNSMFRGISIEEIDLTHFNTSKVETFSYMFANTKLKTIDLSSFETYNRWNTYVGYHRPVLNNMFDSSLVESVILNSLTPTGLGHYNYAPRNNTIKDMFRNTPNLKELDISSFDIPYKLLSSSNPDLGEFIKDSGVETVYVKSRNARDAVRKSDGFRGGFLGFGGVDVIVGGEGYIEPVVRPPAPLQDPGNGGIERVEEGEQTTEEIEFSTRRVKNRTWRDGKEEVKQKGEDGYRVTTNYTIYYTDGRVVEETKDSIEPPIDEIIEYGTIMEEETVERETIYPHETTTVSDKYMRYDPSKGAKGEPVLRKEGKDGKKTWRVKVITHTDGFVEEEIVKNSERTTEAVTEEWVIPLLLRSYSRTETEEIPFETKTTYDYELAYNDGEPHITERGKDGSIRRTYDYRLYIDDSEEWDEHPEKRVRTEPVTQIESIGLIDIIKKEEERKEIEYEVAFEYTKDLLEGEERIKQQGVNGYETRNYEITTYIKHPQTGRTKSPLKKEIREDYKYEAPVIHIIEIGTQEAVTDIRNEVVNKVVRFETEYIDDASLYRGQEVISRQGKDGSSEEKWQTLTFFDGTTQRHHVSTSIVDPISAIVRRGTKDPVVNSYEEVETETLPFETVYIKTNDLANGVEEVMQEGIEGIITITYLVKEYYDGRVERTPIKEERKDAQFRIVKVGTDEVITNQEQVIETEVIEFETETRNDATLYVGEQRIKTEGKDGKIERIYIITQFKGGESEKILIGTTTTQPIKQIVLIGTKRESAGEELENIENLGNKHKGGFLFLEDGDKTIRATTATKIRPIWGYL